MGSRLVVTKISKCFGAKKAVQDVSVSLSSGETVGLLGPNGAGKSTTFNAIVGLLSPDGGQILLDGQDVTALPLQTRARLGLSYLSQGCSIFRKLTVEENLLAIMQLVGLKRSKQKLLLHELLNKFQIQHISKTYGLSLSGGERRRVEIARSLITRPRFLLLDEPFAGVDPVTVQEVQLIINSLIEEGLGVLITDHSAREILNFCSRTYVISDGRVVAEGKAEEVSNNSFVRKIYLGENFRL
ncbi:MAG: LPS export ABC transporter ATP-binding protein [Zetaproteobacteria bacterium]|nr:LPS export ABC transporter ATP-binding protein [Pseudobdellovibrionaceae bacterium]